MIHRERPTQEPEQALDPLNTEQRRAEQGLRNKNEGVRLLLEASAVLLRAEDPNLMLGVLFDKIGPHLGLDTYFHFLVNDSGDALRLASCTGIPEETARTLTRLEFGQAICGTVALHRKPVVATHIQQSDDPMVGLVKSMGMRAYAYHPLLDCNRSRLSNSHRQSCWSTE